MIEKAEIVEVLSNLLDSLSDYKRDPVIWEVCEDGEQLRRRIENNEKIENS